MLLYDKIRYPPQQTSLFLLFSLVHLLLYFIRARGLGRFDEIKDDAQVIFYLNLSLFLFFFYDFVFFHITFDHHVFLFPTSEHGGPSYDHQGSVAGDMRR